MRFNLSVVRDTTRTKLWPLPTLGVLLGLGAGVLLPWIDARVVGDLSGSTSGFLFGGGSDAARSVLSAVASSMITVTSLTFSLTVVTLQLASSQYSPRLLRTFAQDRVVHVTLALFLATFTFALTTLRTVRTGIDAQDPFVPQISVTVAFVLALVSVVGLVVFLAHLASEIRVEPLLGRVRAETMGTVRRTLPAPGEDRAAPPAPSRPPGARPLEAGSTGFLVWVDEQEVCSAAVDADAVVHLVVTPGAFLVAGTPVGWLWAARGAGHLDGEQRRRLQDRVQAAIGHGEERTAALDVAFGVQQMVDVAVKALSPGVNDPTTAVHALGHLSSVLRELTLRDLGPRVLCDDDGAVRAVLARPALADFLDQAVSPPRRYGSQDPDVLARLVELLRELAWAATRTDDVAAVLDHVQRIRSTIGSGGLDQAEAERLEALLEGAEQASSGVYDG